AAAQAGAGVITGAVTERAGGTPIAGATVRATTLPGRTTAASATSNETGRYRLPGLAAGTYAVTATRLGYEVLRVDTVRVAAGETAMVNLALTEAGVQLNQVVVTAGRAPEKILDAPASISVVNTAQIERRPTVTAIDHLRSTPGLDVSQGG